MKAALAPLTTELKENKPWATFDIETDPDDHADCWMVGFFDGVHYVEYESVKDMVRDQLTKRLRSWNVYAHFGGKFDFVHLAATADALGWRWHASMAGRNPRVIGLKVYRGSHVYHFLDSYALLPMKLSLLTEALCPQYGKLAIDFHEATRAELAVYLERDCRGLWHVIKAARELFGQLGTDIKRTIGATAMSLFRRVYLDKPWGVHPWTRRLTSPAKLGGRVEVFRRKAPRLWCADVNSMYPAMMTRHDPPAHCPHAVGRVKRIKPHGLYRVKVLIKDCLVPPLPLKADRLYFPIGAFETICWGPELIAAERAGHEITVLEGIEWTPEPGAFRGFVDELYKLRLRGGPYKIIGKLVMNNIYGKFGEDGFIWSVESGVKDFIPATPEQRGDNVLNWDLGIVARERYRESSHMLHHVGGWITSCARAHLYGLLTASDHPTYCDTDSVWSESRFVPSTDLGGLHVESASSATFSAAKLYCYDDAEGRHVNVAKGMPGADPCRNLPGLITGLCTLKGYSVHGRLFHRELPKEIKSIDRKRLSGYAAPYVTRPPVAGRDCPDRPKEADRPLAER